MTPPQADVPHRDLPTHRAWWIAGFGTVLVGGGLTVLVAAQGSGGRAGLATMLLGAAISCAVGALYAVITAVVDTLRQQPVPGTRIATAVTLFVLGAALPGMLVAVGG